MFMFLQVLFIILPFVSALFFLLSIYGHKLEIKKLNKNIKSLEDQRKNSVYKFTKLNTNNEVRD